eukprot:tig00020509_g9748.t1
MRWLVVGAAWSIPATRRLAVGGGLVDSGNAPARSRGGPVDSGNAFGQAGYQGRGPDSAPRPSRGYRRRSRNRPGGLSGAGPGLGPAARVQAVPIDRGYQAGRSSDSAPRPSRGYRRRSRNRPGGLSGAGPGLGPAAVEGVQAP